MATKLQIYNASLALIKGQFLPALTDDVEERYHLDLHYDDVVAYVLEQGYWNHASRMVQLSAETDVEPTFGHTYAFEKPSDWVRTVRISGNDRLWPTLEDSDYTDEANYWYTSIDPIYVQYVSDGVAYGLDLTLWPLTFQRAVEYELAVRIAPHLSSMNRLDMDNLSARAARAIKDARSKDAMNQGAMRPPPGRLTQARHGRGGRGQSPWWR